jgi:nitric oxide dioxygenase
VCVPSVRRSSFSGRTRIQFRRLHTGRNIASSAELEMPWINQPELKSHMDTHQIALVQQSFEKVATLGEKVPELFYAELFAIDPSLRDMFKGDMKEQHRKLLATLAMVIRSLHTPEKIIGPAQKLAVKHLDYGVAPVHYTYVGNALLRTLKKGLGDQFTPELRDAWVEAFRTLATVMKQAAYGNGAARIKGAA